MISINNNNNRNTSNHPFNHNTINRILKTATHNVRSFTNPTKQQMLMQIYFLHHLDIIGIQETDLNNSQSKSLRRTINSNYQIFLNHNQSAQKSGFGVGLIIKKHFADHVYNCQGALG
jgi:exonuclease III